MSVIHLPKEDLLLKLLMFIYLCYILWKRTVDDMDWNELINIKGPYKMVFIIQKKPHKILVVFFILQKQGVRKW